MNSHGLASRALKANLSFKARRSPFISQARGQRGDGRDSEGLGARRRAPRSWGAIHGPVVQHRLLGSMGCGVKWGPSRNCPRICGDHRGRGLDPAGVIAPEAPSTQNAARAWEFGGGSVLRAYPCPVLSRTRAAHRWLVRKAPRHITVLRGQIPSGLDMRPIASFQVQKFT